MTTFARGLAIGIVTVALLWALAHCAVRAEPQTHPPEHQAAHESFYYFLTRPDIPNSARGSCCSGFDCYPTAARIVNGRWQALRREDRAWIVIPESRVVTKEDELERRPDQQATLCATVAFVYCFVPPQTGI